MVTALLVMVAACSTPPPKAWLRYELDGVTEWTQSSAGIFVGELAGATIRINLRTEIPAEVVIENATEQSVSFAVGPDAGSTRSAIGEVLLRQLGGPTVGGPAMQPYNAMQPLVVDGGWRATFYLDRPLGREPKLGQYFVLSIVAESLSGERVRRTLPLMAKMGGTMPVTLR